MLQDLKVTTTTIKSMDIEPLNVDPNPCGHKKKLAKVKRYGNFYN